MHGGNDKVGHQGIRVLRAGEKFRVRAAGHVVQRRAGQSGIFRNIVDEWLTLCGVEGRAQAVEFGSGQGDAVDDGRSDIAVLHHVQHACLNGLADFRQAHVLAANHEKHGGVEVAGNFGIQIEFENRILAAEVRAKAKNEIVFFLQGFEFVEDGLLQSRGGFLGDDFVGFVFRVGEGVCVVLVQLEIFQHEMDVGILVVKLGQGNDGAENGDFACHAAQKLHDAKGNGAFTRRRTCGCNIE